MVYDKYVLVIYLEVGAVEYTRYIPGIYLARQLQPDPGRRGKQGEINCRHKYLPFIGLWTGLDLSPRLNVTQVPLHLASLQIVALL